MPTQHVPEIITPNGLSSVVWLRDGERILEKMNWGLRAEWIKQPLFKARAETLLEKRSFKDAVLNRRCLIALDGFWETVHIGREIQWHYIRRKDKGLFAAAGLWDPPQDGHGLKACTMVSVAANELILPVNDRMPAILREADEEVWLSAAPEELSKALAVLVPYGADDFVRYRVANGNSTEPKEVGTLSMDLFGEDS